VLLGAGRTVGHPDQPRRALRALSDAHDPAVAARRQRLLVEYLDLDLGPPCLGLGLVGEHGGVEVGRCGVDPVPGQVDRARNCLGACQGGLDGLVGGLVAEEGERRESLRLAVA
jgi:hypothetical protein